MAKDTVKIKDKHRRIYLSEEIWEAEGLRVGDLIEIDVTKIERKKPPEGEA